MTPDAAHFFDGLREPWLHDPRCREAHGPERTVFPCAWHARPGEHYLDEETAEVRSGLTGNVVFRVRADAVPHARYVEMGTMGVAAPRLVDTETGEILHHEAVHEALAIPRGESECLGCRNPRCPDHWREPRDWPRLFHPLARRLPPRAFRRWVLWRGDRLARPARSTVSTGPR